MSLESVNVFVTDDNLIPGDPVAGVVVRVFDSTGTVFITQGISDINGRVGFSLPAPASFQLRFFKEQFSTQQPVIISPVLAPFIPQLNDFMARGHVFKPPEAVHPRLCRCSGFFRRPDNSVARRHDIQIIAQFDPLLFEGTAMLTERLHLRTDDQGYVQTDLVRFGQYLVTIEGSEDQQRVITVPDAPSVNLPDLIFPVIESITFDPPAPWELLVGQAYDFTIVPTVYTSDGRVLPGTAIADVIWSTDDPLVAVVLPTATTLTLRGQAPGLTALNAKRADNSIIRIPNPGIEGVPADIGVS